MKNFDFKKIVQKKNKNYCLSNPERIFLSKFITYEELRKAGVITKSNYRNLVKARINFDYEGGDING